MGYFLAAYFIGLMAATAYDPSFAAWGIIGAGLIGAVIGVIAFCESWTEFFIGIPVGLFLCACATI